MYGNKNNKVKSKSMKKFTLFIALILTAVFGVKTTASAKTYETEEQIEWINYAVTIQDAITNYGSTTDGIYLCHWDGNKTYTFVNVGGEYGTQAITSNRGMRLTITRNRNWEGYSSCTIKGTLNNPGAGSYLGVEPNGTSHTDRVFMDRGAGDSQDRYYHWNITSGGTSHGKSYYNIENTATGSYLSTETAENTLRIVSTNTDKWLFIPRKAFRDVLLSVTHQTNIEVSGLIQNTRFVRYMDENASWNWYTISGTSHGTQLSENAIDRDNGAGLGIANYGAYRSMAPGAELIKNENVKDHDGQTNITLDYAKSYGSFSAGEMKKPIVMRQQISGIRPGTYTITAQAFVSDNDNVIDNTNNSNIAFLFAAGTSGVSQGAEIRVLNDEEQTNFTNNFYNYHKDVLTKSAPQYFRGNVAAGEYLATGGDYTKSSDAIYNPNTEFKTITLNVTVTDSGNGTGTLTIGAAKYQEQGTLYIANIDIKYSGTYEFGIDSYSTDNTAFSETNTDGIDEYRYGYARQFNLVRDFNITAAGQEANAKWEALVLPVNLTATQVRTAFGNDVKLSKLVGLANNGNQIRFEAVDLTSNGDATAILAGDCYVIKVTKAPEVARNVPYEFDVYSNDEFTGDIKVPVTYYGPIYQIDGLTRTSKLGDLIKINGGKYANGVVTKTYTTDDGDLEFTGYFYWNQTAPKDAYVVSRGKMFYLDADNIWANLTGTMWKLKGPSFTGAKELSIDFGDGDITNGISGITVEGENNVNATGIYNLNGQKVSDGTSTESLSKGIYIVNGKKYVVR